MREHNFQSVWNLLYEHSRWFQGRRKTSGRNPRSWFSIQEEVIHNAETIVNMAVMVITAVVSVFWRADWIGTSTG